MRGNFQEIKQKQKEWLQLQIYIMCDVICNQTSLSFLTIDIILFTFRKVCQLIFLLIWYKNPQSESWILYWISHLVANFKFFSPTFHLPALLHTHITHTHLPFTPAEETNRGSWAHWDVATEEHDSVREMNSLSADKAAVTSSCPPVPIMGEKKLGVILTGRTTVFGSWVEPQWVQGRETGARGPWLLCWPWQGNENESSSRTAFLQPHDPITVVLLALGLQGF